METVAQTKTAQPKSLPERTCVGCHAKKSQHKLLRVASHGGQSPVIDKEYARPGRGAYLCFDRACWQRAQKRRAIERALKLRDGLPRAFKEEIDKLLSGSMTRSEPDEKSPSASPK